MVNGRQYPAELRERAVRLVQESVRDGRGEWEAMRSVAEKLGIGSPETVRKSVMSRLQRKRLEFVWMCGGAA